MIPILPFQAQKVPQITTQHRQIVHDFFIERSEGLFILTFFSSFNFFFRVVVCSPNTLALSRHVRLPNSTRQLLAYAHTRDTYQAPRATTTKLTPRHRARESSPDSSQTTDPTETRGKRQDQKTPRCHSKIQEEENEISGKKKTSGFGAIWWV